MLTYNVTSKDLVRKWYLVDAKGKILGRLASRIANIIRGKEKAAYAPGLNNGDNVLVINAGLIKVTGNKAKDMIFRSHSNFPGGLKEIKFDAMMKKKPDFALKKAVWGMLPHNSLGRKMLKNVRIYANEKHDMSIKDIVELKV